MADVDIDPFGDHNKTESRPDEPMGENIHLTAGGGSTWEPEHEQETSFGGGRTQERRFINSYVDSLYEELSKHYNQTSDAIFYDDFKLELEGRQLYFKGRDESLTKQDGTLRKFSRLKEMLGTNRLHFLGFIPRGKVTAEQAIALNKAEEECLLHLT